MMSPQQQLSVEQTYGLRDDHGAHRFERAGMEIVSAMKKHYAPVLDDNDGGQILAWLIAFADEVFVAGTQSVLERSHEPRRDRRRIRAEEGGPDAT
jgi:hypothetical protein